MPQMEGRPPWNSYDLHVVFVGDSAWVRSSQLDPRNVVAIEEQQIGAGEFDQVDGGLFEPRPSSRIHHRVVAIGSDC